MRRPPALKALPKVPGWPRSRIEAQLSSPARRSDADRARFRVDLEAPLDPTGLPAVLQTDRPGLTAAAAWLCWTVAQQSLHVVQTGQPVQVTLLDKSGGETLRVAIVDAQGQRREADVPRDTNLKAYAVDEVFAAHADPQDPDVLRPDNGLSLRAGVGMLAFFAVAFAGAGLFLWRTRSPTPRHGRPFHLDR